MCENREKGVRCDKSPEENENTQMRTLVTMDHKRTDPKITAVLIEHLENPVNTKTVCQKLHKPGLREKTAIRK